MFAGFQRPGGKSQYKFVIVGDGAVRRKEVFILKSAMPSLQPLISEQIIVVGYPRKPGPPTSDKFYQNKIGLTKGNFLRRFNYIESSVSCR